MWQEGIGRDSFEESRAVKCPAEQNNMNKMGKMSGPTGEWEGHTGLAFATKTRRQPPRVSKRHWLEGIHSAGARELTW